jgi:hypothetical protein
VVVSVDGSVSVLCGSVPSDGGTTWEWDEQRGWRIVGGEELQGYDGKGSDGGEVSYLPSFPMRAVLPSEVEC